MSDMLNPPHLSMRRSLQRRRREGAGDLAAAISGHGNLPGRECYSRFDLTKIH